MRLSPLAGIVVLLLAFLLFTPLGRSIGEVAVSELLATKNPAPGPAKVATDEAANQEWCATHGEHAYHFPPCR